MIFENPKEAINEERGYKTDNGNIGNHKRDGPEKSALSENNLKLSLIKKCHHCGAEAGRIRLVKCQVLTCQNWYCRKCLTSQYKHSKEAVKSLPSSHWQCPQCKRQCLCTACQTSKTQASRISKIATDRKPSSKNDKKKHSQENLDLEENILLKPLPSKIPIQSTANKYQKKLSNVYSGTIPSAFHILGLKKPQLNIQRNYSIFPFPKISFFPLCLGYDKISKLFPKLLESHASKEECCVESPEIALNFPLSNQVEVQNGYRSIDSRRNSHLTLPLPLPLLLNTILSKGSIEKNQLEFQPLTFILNETPIAKVNYKLLFLSRFHFKNSDKWKFSTLYRKTILIF